MDIRLLFTETFDHMNYRRAMMIHCGGHKPMFLCALNHEQAHEWVHKALNLKPEYLRS